MSTAFSSVLLPHPGASIPRGSETPLVVRRHFNTQIIWSLLWTLLLHEENAVPSAFSTFTKIWTCVVPVQVCEHLFTSETMKLEIWPTAQGGFSLNVDALISSAQIRHGR